MSKKSRILKVIENHQVSQSWYDSDNYGTYHSECCCGMEFSSGEIKVTEDLHNDHLYAKLKKAMKKRKKKRTINVPVNPALPFLGTKSQTVYY